MEIGLYRRKRVLYKCRTDFHINKYKNIASMIYFTNICNELLAVLKNVMRYEAPSGKI